MDVPKKPVNIFLNGDKLKPCDPFLTKNTQTKALPEEIVKIEGEDVAVKAFILPVESKLAPDDIDLMGGLSRTLQGFWVYRNKRLIIPGTWFKLTNKKELTKLARVRVDLPNTLDSQRNPYQLLFLHLQEDRLLTCCTLQQVCPDTYH